MFFFFIIDPYAFNSAKHLHVDPTYPCRILACVWQSSWPPRPPPPSEPPGWWDWTDPDLPPPCPPNQTRCPWYRTRGCGAEGAAVVAAAPGKQTPTYVNPVPKKECRLHRAAGTEASRLRSLRIRYRAVSADGEETPLSRKVMQKKTTQRERLLQTITKPIKNAYGSHKKCFSKVCALLGWLGKILFTVWGVKLP